MNILVTGGAGFIGSALVRRLVGNDHDVTVLDNLSPQIHGSEPIYRNPDERHVRFLPGDVRNREDWIKALDGQQAVVHLAAETGTGQSMYEIERYMDVNVRGTAVLLDVIANQPTSVRKLVVASSRAIYGEGRYRCVDHGYVYPLARSPKDMERGDFNVKCPTCGVDVELVATTEESAIHPSSIYGLSKQVQEQMVLMTARALGISAVALRYQNVYGPGQSLSNPYTGILSIFSTRIRNNSEIVIFEDGKESRDFVFIDDVIDATVSAISCGHEGQFAANIGTGRATTVSDVARSLIDGLGIAVPMRVSGAFRLGDIRHNLADIQRARDLLGYEPRVGFNEGARLFSSWVKSQPTVADTYEKSISEMQRRGMMK
jgi:dTDP-L-rhamnose 4-epimerase